MASPDDYGKLIKLTSYVYTTPFISMYIYITLKDLIIIQAFFAGIDKIFFWII